MVVKADQERVKTLLKDTITLLCRNGLSFKSKFNIEALIGVTLDDDDVFLISINELIKTEAEKAREKELEAEAAQNAADISNSQISEEGNRKRKRRKRARVKTESGNDASSGEETENSGEERSNGAESDHQGESSSQSMPAEPSAKRPNHRAVKEEAEEEEEDDEDDLVFIKEEPHEASWQQQTDSIFSNVADTSNMSNSGFGDDQNFASLSDMSLIPIGSQEEGAMWAQTSSQIGTSMPQRPYKPRGPRTSTVTTGSPGADGQMAGPAGQDPSQCDATNYACDICGKAFTWKQSCNRHRRSHFGVYRLYCPYCNKGFMNKVDREGHLSTQHGHEKQFQCDICTKTFCSKRRLDGHVIGKHGGSNA